MTTAPDLPPPQTPAFAERALDPYPAEAARPILSVVPAQHAPEEAIEFDEALRRAEPRLALYPSRKTE